MQKRLVQLQVLPVEKLFKCIYKLVSICRICVWLAPLLSHQHSSSFLKKNNCTGGQLRIDLQADLFVVVVALIPVPHFPLPTPSDSFVGRGSVVQGHRAIGPQLRLVVERRCPERGSARLLKIIPAGCTGHHLCA